MGIRIYNKLPLHIKEVSNNHRKFEIYLKHFLHIGPGVYSASNRNEYQKHKNNVSGV
jgi:hypothetical protein